MSKIFQISTMHKIVGYKRFVIVAENQERAVIELGNRCSKIAVFRDHPMFIEVRVEDVTLEVHQRAKELRREWLARAAYDSRNPPNVIPDDFVP